MRTALLINVAASLLHFTHNAEYLNDYPNLPAWISRDSIYLVWFGTTTVGAIGYLLYLRRRSMVGLVLLILYSIAGLDGLLHYTRAPIRAHTTAMNVTILFEVAMAFVLLAVLMPTAIAALIRRSWRE